MSFRLNEPVIEAIRARLVANLPAAISTRNATVEDGFLLREPGAIFDFIPGDKRLSAHGYEAVGIGDLKTEFRDDIGAVVTGDHKLAIMVYLADHDAEALAKRLRRMLQVVIEVVLAGRDLDIPNFEGIRPQAVDYGPTLDREEEPRLVRTFAAITVEVSTEDS